MKDSLDHLSGIIQEREQPLRTKIDELTAENEKLRQQVDQAAHAQRLAGDPLALEQHIMGAKVIDALNRARQVGHVT